MSCIGLWDSIPFWPFGQKALRLVTVDLLGLHGDEPLVFTE
jgi:hypothetical protein